VLARNFYFTILDDRSTLPIIERVGVDHVLFETDYPHADSLWPSVQDAIEALFAPLTAEQTAKITHANAATLFRHPLPESVVERVDHQRAEGRS
jgi:predicted TIM-barrel fold metal-dependent hydrolase